MPKECVHIINIMLIQGVKGLIFRIKLKGVYSERRIERLIGMQTTV